MEFQAQAILDAYHDFYACGNSLETLELKVGLERNRSLQALQWHRMGSTIPKENYNHNHLDSDISENSYADFFWCFGQYTIELSQR